MVSVSEYLPPDIPDTTSSKVWTDPDSRARYLRDLEIREMNENGLFYVRWFKPENDKIIHEDCLMDILERYQGLKWTTMSFSNRKYWNCLSWKLQDTYMYHTWPIILNKVEKSYRNQLDPKISKVYIDKLMAHPYDYVYIFQKEGE